MLVTLCVATILILIATLLPLSRNPHWLVRGMDFPRLQIAVIAALLIVVGTVLLDTGNPLALVLLAVTALCLAWQLWWILPYTPLWPKEVPRARSVDPGHRIRILTANVLTPNRDADRLLTLVHEHVPDILVTLESDAWWESHLDTLAALLPHAIRCPLDNLYGMHVYSRLPLADAEIRYLVEDDVPSMHAEVTLPSGAPVRMHFLHPRPPSPTENPESEERDVELVIVARSVAQADTNRAVIVTGDLNDVAWSRTTRLFRKLSGLLDPRVGRGMYNTFHADWPFLRWPVDHLFHSEHFTLASIRLMPHIGSDHFALLTELVHAPYSRSAQNGLEADAEHRAFADELVDARDASAADVPRPET